MLDQRIIEQGKFAPCYSKSKVYDAISEIVNMVNLTLDQTQLKIVHTRMKGDEIRFDVRRLQQVLLNILSNATKYQRVGEITVTYDVQRQENNKAIVQVQVVDRGQGMTNEQRLRIFEPFGGQTSEKIKTHMSNGVGLSICKQLC